MAKRTPDWPKAIEKLKSSVPKGTVTTYGDLWVMFKGGDKGDGGSSVGSMLKAAKKHDINNALYTNRVVKRDGKMEFDDQKKQLKAEGIPMKNGKVDTEKARIITAD